MFVLALEEEVVDEDEYDCLDSEEKGGLF